MREINTILPDSLLQALELYTNEQASQSTPDAVIQAALEEFLAQRGYFPQFKKTLIIQPAPQGSGYTDTSINHDQVLTRQPSEEES